MRISTRTATVFLVVLAACTADDPDLPVTQDVQEPSEESALSEAPDLATLASFALEFLEHSVLYEGEMGALAHRYFVEDTFAPYEHFGVGRPAPPEDVRAWVARGDPLRRETRGALVDLGFTLCRVDLDQEVFCDAVEQGERFLGLGIGEVRRTGDSRWSFEAGFVIIGTSSGVSTGAARFSIRTSEGAWRLIAARTLWLDH
jgi:hypothetical protein